MFESLFRPPFIEEPKLLLLKSRHYLKRKKKTEQKTVELSIFGKICDVIWCINVLYHHGKSFCTSFK